MSKKRDKISEHVRALRSVLAVVESQEEKFPPDILLQTLKHLVFLEIQRLSKIFDIKNDEIKEVDVLENLAGIVKFAGERNILVREEETLENKTKEYSPRGYL